MPTRLLLLCIQIPYRRHYRTAIADAFDIYIEIRKIVDRGVMVALGRDAPHWRAKNACPACSYKVPSLVHDVMWLASYSTSIAVA